MHWDIPTIPDKTRLNKPNYRIILVFFTAIALMLYMYSTTLSSEQKYQLFLFSIPTLILLFIFSIGFLFIRHQRSAVTYDNWEKEKHVTKQEWQAWCQSSITCLANVIHTPDKEGALVFLQDAPTIPQFPDKPRRLLNNISIDHTLLSSIDVQLEKQCPNYRQCLSNIYLFDNSNTKESENLIFNQWDLKPIQSTPTDYEKIFSVYDDVQTETFLIITIQSQTQYSEFISAQLFSTNREWIRSIGKGIEVERIMAFDSQNIESELTQYINYSGISKNKAFQTWLSKTQQEVINHILMTYSNKNITYNKSHPIQVLSMSYSVPHPNAFLTYLSLLSDIALNTEKDQVFIHLNPDNSGYAVYINHRL